MRNCNCIIILISIFLGFFGCEDPNSPDSIWDPNQQMNPDPIINQVVAVNMTGYTPMANSMQTYSGVGKVKFVGENFSDQLTDNLVFFNSKEAEILSTSSTEITVRVPNIETDSAEMKIATLGAYLYSNTITPFKLMPVFGEIGGFIDNENISALACDKAENVLISKAREIFIIDPDSVGKKTKYAGFSAAGASSMRIGSGGYLYFIQTFAMFRIGPAGASDPTWFSLFPRTMILKDLDFDQNGHLFCSGSSGDIYRVDTDTKASSLEATLDSTDVAAVRVYENYLYVAGAYFGSDSTGIQKGIWKLPIAADGTLGTAELVLDWLNYTNNQFINITSITFAADGKLFIGSDDGDALTILHTDGTLEPFYKQVLSTPINKIVWGTGDYLYANYGKLGSKRLWKINMGESGSPYYGRN